MMKKRSAFGWGELILGIVLIILGIFTFARPYSALAGIVFVYGFLALITGIGDIVFYISDRNLKYPCRSSAAVSSQCRKLGNGGSVSFMVYRPLHFPADPSADHTDNFRNGILLFFSYSKYPGAGIGILYDLGSGLFFLLCCIYHRILSDAHWHRSSGAGDQQYWNEAVKLPPHSSSSRY